MKQILFILIITFSSYGAFAQGFVEMGESFGVNYDFNTDEYGGGVSFVDFDQDGLDDLTFTSGPGEHLRFHKNTGAGFVELDPLVSNTSETKQVFWIDYDNDGLLDLYVTSVNENRLYKNIGNLEFQDVTETLGLPLTDQLTFTSLWFDYDQDGWIDLFTTYRTVDEKGRVELYRNNKGSNFENQTTKAGLLGKGNSVLTMTSFDYDNDGLTDLFLAQDWEQGNQLLRNTGKGTFTDVSRQSNTNQKMNSMTATVADFNEDGWFDIYVSNTREGTILLKNNQDGTFTEVAEEMGIKIRSLTFGSIFFDADNDSDLDLHIVGGQVNYMFENVGKGLPYKRVNDEWGFSKDRFFNNGFSVGDHNGDGYVDLVKNSMTLTGTVSGVNTFWENQFSSNNYLSVDLKGVISNFNAIGAIVKVYLDNRVLKRRVASGESFCSQLSYTQFFGVGSTELIDKVVVEWPSGNITEVLDVEPNQRLKIIEPNKGCTDAAACNYVQSDQSDNTLCRYTETYYDCSGCLNDTDQDGVCDELEITGCMDVMSCSFNPSATNDDGSCTYPETFEISGPIQVNPMTVNQYKYAGGVSSNYYWEAENGSVIIGQGSGEVQVIWHENLPGTLSVTETNSDDCIGQTISISIEETVLGGIKSKFNPFEIYPNPAEDYTKIKLKGDASEMKISILDLQGKVHIIENANHAKYLDLSSLSNGIYIFRVLIDGQIHTSKLIVEKP